MCRQACSDCTCQNVTQNTHRGHFELDMSLQILVPEVVQQKFTHFQALARAKKWKSLRAEGTAQILCSITVHTRHY
jgi:hypothetical protein